jgi:hypothetical protein
MQTSIFIARLLGPFYTLRAIAMLLRPEEFRAIVRGYIGSSAMMYWVGLAGFLGGLAVVTAHNVWVLDWRFIVTLVGWAGLLRGVVAVLAPYRVVAIGTKLLEHKKSLYSAALAELGLGLILTAAGYFA